MAETVLIVVVKGLVLIAFLFGAAAYMTFLERVVLARLQQRMGPNRIGPLGLLQPIADGIKLLCKENFKPAGADTFTYWLAPFISLMSALFIFVIIPFGGKVHLFGREITLQIADINAGIFFLLAFSSLAVYGVVLAGYSSNSRYSLLGGLRGTAQMVSYEIPMGISLLTIALSAGSLSLSEIVEQQKNAWYIWTNPVAFLIYFITAFAETNRAPFDLPEAEQELTGGYHTEYAGIKFASFFLGEYINILAVSAISATLFFGGYLGPFELPLVWFLLKVAFFVLIFLWVRATMARFRYGDLMSFGWKVLTPLAILNLIITAYFVLV
ncbi:MAG TPA: NADH-quinone oxidoreductase subunit NuoH [Parachlamydiaceae bacterium]|nr:NADH-quinone oxidoreductase subunit NuoH [Parachlamydiaceae bacterium]